LRTLFLLHEQRHLYFEEPSYLELYLPMLESGRLGETQVLPYQRELRFARERCANKREAGELVQRLLEQKIIEFRPEWVVYALTWPQECIEPRVLAELKRRHRFQLVSVVWDHDESNPLLQEYDRQIIKASDCTLIADSHSRATAMRARSGPYAAFANTERVVFLPMVPPASLFHPRAEKRHDITISGSSEGHRVAVCEQLITDGFQVHRSGGMMPTDAMLSIEDYAADLAASRIVVNTQTLGSRTQVKGRVAQCLASGTLLLEQDNAESRSYLAGIEVPLWRDTTELAQLLRHFMAEPAQRDAMAQRAHAQWKARYSAAGFVQTICDTLARPAAAPATTPHHPASFAAIKTPKRQEGQPMDFYIVIGNHINTNGIGDTVMLLKNALQDCGHTVRVSHAVIPGAINILLELFSDEAVLRTLVEGHAKGARYILIGTEPITGGTFNGGIDGSHWHYSNSSYWQQRFDGFKVAAAMADAVWVLAESMLPGYTALLPELPVRFLPHGYVSDYATVRQRPEAERDIDFHFSGTLTEHRTLILGTLGQRFSVAFTNNACSEYLRQDEISRTKVCLSLRLSPHNEIPSVSRMHYHLQNRSFLVHESYALPCLLDPFVLKAPPGDLLTWAEAALALPNRRELADNMHERFKAELPMTRLLPPLVDEVLARISGPVRRYSTAA
jgi:hypothetical protein